MYSYEIFEIEGGYGFHIERDGTVTISQEFKPGAGGFVRMSEVEAQEEAVLIIGRLNDGN